MISISSSAYARKRHGVPKDEIPKGPIGNPPISDDNHWSFWDWIRSLFNGKWNESNALNDRGDRNPSPIRDQWRTSQWRYTNTDTGNTWYWGYQTWNSWWWTTLPPEPPYHWCWRFLKRLLITFLLLFLLAFIAEFLDNNSSIKDSI